MQHRRPPVLLLRRRPERSVRGIRLPSQQAPAHPPRDQGRLDLDAPHLQTPTQGERRTTHHHGTGPRRIRYN